MTGMRMLAIGFAILAIVFALSGCDNPSSPTSTTETTTATVPTTPTEPKMTADVLAAKIASATEENTTTHTSVTLQLNMQINMSASNLNMGITIGAEALMDILKTAEPYSAYTNMSMTLNVPGGISEESMQIYSLIENDMLSRYTYTESLDAWARASIDVSEEDMLASNAHFNWLTEKDSAELTLDEDTRRFDGRQVYMLRCTLTGEELGQVMNYIGGTNGAADGIILAGADSESVSVSTVMFVDSKTFLPIRIEMDIQGLDDILKQPLSNAIDSDISDMDLEASIDDFQIVYYNISYDPVEVPSLPEEAIKYVMQSGYNPDKGDGSYVIQESGDAVRITCPEGWTASAVMAYDNVTFIRDDYGKTITYTMYTDMTNADIVSLIEEDYIQEIKTLGIYNSHGFGPVIGNYENIWVRANGLNQCYAWTPIGNGWLLVVLSDYTGQESVDELMPLLDIVEEYDLRLDALSA